MSDNIADAIAGIVACNDAPAAASNTAASVSSSSSASASSGDEEAAELNLLRSLITSHEDFPSAGVSFKDIFPIFRVPSATRILLSRLSSAVRTVVSSPIDVVVGLDARGFLFGPALALELNAAFVPVRKAGKLPGPCEKGGTLASAAQLVRALGGEVAACIVVIELISLQGRRMLTEKESMADASIVSLLKY